MSLDAWIVLAVLAAVFALLIVTKLPAWSIFLGALTIVMTLGLAPVPALLGGFSNTGVLTVAVLFMVAAGMYRTGAITMLADRLIRRPTGVGQALRRTLPPVAGASAFLNNTPLVAMMIPVVRDLGRTSSHIPPSKLYMPVSFASILGGAATLIGTSTNLIVAGLVAKEIADGSTGGLSAITVFTPTAVGLPAALVGLVFLLAFGARLLPKKSPGEEQYDPARRFLTQFVIDPRGPLVGRGLAQSGLSAFAGSDLVRHQRAHECPWPVGPKAADDDAQAAEAATGQVGPGARLGAEAAVVRTAFRHALDAAGEVLKPSLAALKPSTPEADVRLEAGDVLTFVGSLDAVTALWTTMGLRAAAAPVKMEHEPYTHRLVEVVMSDTSEAVGHDVVQLPLEYSRDFHSRVVAIALNQHHEGEDMSEMRVEVGDTLVLEVSPSFLYDARNEADFALVRRLSGYKIKRTSRAPIAGGIALAMVLLAAFGVTTMLNAALLATFAMIATGCLSFRTAFRSMEFEVIVVLAAAVGLGAAVTESGLAEAVASLLVTVGGASPYLAIVIIFLGAVIATNVINAAAAAALLFPVAVGMAEGMGVSAMPFVIVLMLAASYSFVNPAGFQTNLMVQKPGGYTFMDFAKVGLPLTVLVGVVVCVLTPIFFPFALP